jgi:hypothetical protein
MSGLKVEALQREFFYNGTRIAIPASADDIFAHMAAYMEAPAS